MKSPYIQRRELSQRRNDRRPTRKSQQGYLLIEMILAVAVVAVAAAVILGSLSSTMRASAAGEKFTRATLLLQELASDASKNGIAVPSEGNFDTGAPGFRWRAGQSQSPCCSDVCPVTLTVLWTERGATRSSAITIFIKKQGFGTTK